MCVLDLSYFDEYLSLVFVLFCFLSLVLLTGGPLTFFPLI